MLCWCVCCSGSRCEALLYSAHYCWWGRGTREGGGGKEKVVNEPEHIGRCHAGERRSWVLGKQSCCEDNCNCPRLSHVGHCGGRGRWGGGGMSDAYQVLMRRFRAAAPAAATPPTGYTHFTSLTQTLSGWSSLKHSLIQPNTKLLDWFLNV